jgi:hypothetical protein
MVILLGFVSPLSQDAHLWTMKSISFCSSVATLHGAVVFPENGADLNRINDTRQFILQWHP